MIYEVGYSAKARQDLREVYRYIAEELLVPETAKAQTSRIMKAIRSLEKMPMRHRLYEEEPWYSQGLRVLPVDNYIVFYLPDDTVGIVYIVRIMYGGRDIDKQLNETDVLLK